MVVRGWGGCGKGIGRDADGFGVRVVAGRVWGL